MKKTIRVMVLMILLLSLVTAAVSCGEESKSTAEQSATEQLWASARYTSDTEVGQGNTTFRLKVTALEKSIVITVHTNQTNLAQALLENNLVEGEDSTYGLYIKKVNGILADYDVDQTYWGLKQNSEDLMTGVSGVTIAQGAEYELAYAK